MFPRPFLGLFLRLRRCRALFALALCAWLALASVAWVQPDCCEPMGMSPGMAMPHGMAGHGHDATHVGTTVSDGCCAHASIQVPAPLAQNLPSPMPATAGWQRHREVAPQPFYEPPLRPPVA